MLRRPKPSESEADLLREQRDFLAAGGRSTVTALKRPDKRRGDAAQGPRDVVTIEDLPDQIPTLTPGPAKRSRFKQERSVRFEDEDPEEQLDSHDSHISVVLSKIVERDTSTVPVLLPSITGTAFPKVLHRSVVEHEEVGSALKHKKSIFARQFAAKKAAKDLQCVNVSRSAETSNGPLLVSGQGLRLANGAVESMKIHEENQAKLQAMSRKEILEEQKKLLAQLDPRVVDFVRSRKPQTASQSAAGPQQSVISPDFDRVNKTEHFELAMEEEDEEESEHELQTAISVDELPVKPEKDWIHMDKVESEKLEWTRDLPPPRRQSTKKTMQARFAFDGTLVPPTKDVPTHLGLHHHGEEPERAGYSLQDLFLLSRSQLNQQRNLAVSTLANVLFKARAGEFTSCLKGSILLSLLDAGLLFLLRFSLDDGVESVMSAAVRALRSLLSSPDDEECLDNIFPWMLGMATYPLAPICQEDEDDDEDGEAIGSARKETATMKEERKSDNDVARLDVVKGFVRMQGLSRLRYILEIVRPSPPVVRDILEVLIRVARHSCTAATQILDCPRLMDTVTAQFILCVGAPSSSQPLSSLYGHPVALAMKLLRVLASAGRHACARILNFFSGKEILSRFVIMDPSEMLLQASEAIRCSLEALRLFAVAVSYGHACNLYIDLYPVLVKTLQAGSRLWTDSEALQSLKLEKLRALLVLLTQVIQTAGCHEELQRRLVSADGKECPPPPLVTWSHVTGLHPTIISSVKSCVRALDSPAQMSSALILLPSYLLCVEAYYSQLTVQSSFQPVQCLQELESVTSEMLQPLISHPAMQNITSSIRSSSIICNPGLTSNAEYVPSLPGLGCSKLKTTIATPNSPLFLPTALLNLLNTISSIHKGLAKLFSSILLSDSVLGYLRSCVRARPIMSHSSAWILRHEHHLLYHLLRLAHKMVPIDSDVAKYAPLFHQVSLVLVSWLLPGSEYLAHELMTAMIFHHSLLPEGGHADPEVSGLAELQIKDRISPTASALLHDALLQLPSIRACYLTHLAYMEPAVQASCARHLGQTLFISSQLLPELTGPSLPSDWAYLPLISLYDKMAGGQQAESVPQGSVLSTTHCLQWLLLLENWRENALYGVSPVAKFARLACVFLCSSDLFLERPVQELTWALFGRLTRPSQLEVLDLGSPPPGLASFHDLYSALLAQYEAVSFGDPLFGCFMLLPLQRRYSVSLRLAVLGEHVGVLRSLGVSLKQLAIPLEKFTAPAEDSLPLLRLYFRALVSGALRRKRCPVLYVVAVSHLNSFIFSQDAVAEELETERQGLLKKTYCLTDEELKSHLLLFRTPQQDVELGFCTYEQLPPLRARRLESIVGTEKTG